jgi:hypothetical protein
MPVALVRDDVTIVPGHGGLISINDIRNALAPGTATAVR